MNRTGDRAHRLSPFLRVFALAGLPVLLFFVFLSAVGAQEPTNGSTPVATIASGDTTPASTVEPTPDLSIKTVVHIDVDPGPFKSGQQFEARVMVDNVEHLAGFSFTINYDPKRLQPVKLGSAEITPEDTPVAGLSGTPIKGRAIGDIFGTSPRSDVVACPPPTDQDSAVIVTCVTRAPPVCLGGPAGASGSGLLGAVYFKSKGGGVTTLTLSTSQLVLDDYEDCAVEVQGTTGVLPNDCLPIRAEPSDTADQLSCKPDGTAARAIDVSGNIQERAFLNLEGLGWAATDFLQPTSQVPPIPNRQQNAQVLLTGGGSSSTLLVVIIAVVVVAMIGGGGGYLWYRRRQARPSV